MVRGRILVIDEAPAARAALRELLEEEGYQVLAVTGAPGERAAAKQFRPDLALVDVGQVARSEDLREIAGVAKAAVLMSSREPIGKPDGPFLRKPIRVPELVATVAEAMDRARQRP